MAWWQCELGRDKSVNKTNKIIYIWDPLSLWLWWDTQFACENEKWYGNERWAACAACTFVLLCLTFSVQAALPSHSRDRTKSFGEKRRHFNTFNATYCSIVTANHIKQLLYLYINSHSRLPAMEEKWSSLIVYTTECYVSLISYFFFLSFLLRLGSFFHWSSVAFHHSCIISYDINEIKAERWKYHLMPCTMETLMHIIWHDYFAHLTGFIFKSGVCVCVCRAHFDISIARSRLHFELASRVNTCYDLSTVHRMYQMLSSDFLWLHIHDYTVLNWHTE